MLYNIWMSAFNELWTSKKISNLKEIGFHVNQKINDNADFIK